MNHFIGFSLNSMTWRDKLPLDSFASTDLCLSQALNFEGNRLNLRFISVSRKMYKMLEYEKVDS